MRSDSDTWQGNIGAKRRNDDMTTALFRELRLRCGIPAGELYPGGNYDPFAECHHKPSQTYTRKPCSCGRELWPPRGRGRGEAISSPRRIVAHLRAMDALDLAGRGMSYEAIARRLGYKHRASAWNAVHRLTDEAAAWRNYEERTGYRMRREPTPAELREALAAVEERLAARLDQKPLRDAQQRLRRLLVDTTRKQVRGKPHKA